MKSSIERHFQQTNGVLQTKKEKKALQDNNCWIVLLENDTQILCTCLYHSLSPHLPHAGSAAENSDCAVV